MIPKPKETVNQIERSMIKYFIFFFQYSSANFLFIIIIIVSNLKKLIFKFDLKWIKACILYIKTLICNTNIKTLTLNNEKNIILFYFMFKLFM